MEGDDYPAPILHSKCHSLWYILSAQVATGGFPSIFPSRRCEGDERRIFVKTLLRILSLAMMLLGILFLGQPTYAPPLVHAQSAPCAPYGDPMRATNTYYVCTQAQDSQSGIYELRITCKDSTAHPGYRWHLWSREINYQIDESHAGCNKHDVYANQSTCCQRAIAAHCTDADPGAPGGNGCATWNDDGH